MAVTHRVSISLEDYSGDTDNVPVYLDGTLTVAQVQSVVDAFCAELDPITGAKITGATVALALTLPAGLKATATDKEDMERGINWRFSAADTQYSHTIRTPAAPDALVDGETLVGTADTTDFITVMLDGDAVNEPTDPYGNDLDGALSQRITFRK